MMRLLLILIAYLIIGYAESCYYNYAGIIEILLWPVTTPIIWWLFNDDTPDQDE